MENQKENIQKELLNLLESAPLHKIFQTIRSKAQEGSPDVPGFLRSIFKGSSSGSDDCEKRKYETFKFSISVLQMPDLSYNIASELVALLLLEINSISTSVLMKIAELFVIYAKDSKIICGKWLEVLPKILSCLSSRDSIVYNGTEVSGIDLKKQIISLLTSSELSVPCLVKLASVLKDVDLSEEEMESVAEKLIKAVPLIEVNELPPFIYQLLLLSSKGQRKKILQNIMSYFIEKDNRLRHISNENADTEDSIDNHNEDAFRQIEGTVILFIVVAARQDQTISKEFVQLTKVLQHKPDIILSPFSFSIALSLTKIQRYEEQIFESLKKSMMMSFQFKERKLKSFWLKNLVPANQDILELIKEAITNSQYGWDHVCQGLVKFGFAVLESYGPKRVFGREVSNSTSSAVDEACSLGNCILRDTFKVHRLVRSDIFEQILNRIITNSHSPVSHYIDVLAQTVQGDPQLLLEILAKLIEILDYLPSLPYSNAVGIMQALTPLLKVSMPLKDTLMLVLRKALFHRDLESRKVAISGYLTILKKINYIGKVSLSQSQGSQIGSQGSSQSSSRNRVQVDVYFNTTNPNSKLMCLEIMGILKRALMQQAEIRQLLYESLYDVVAENNALADIILELLLSQLEKYYVVDDSNPALDLEICMLEQKDSILLEPIAHLITSIHMILLEIRNRISNDDFDNDNDLSAQIMLEDMFKSLTKRMANTDVEDLDVNKSGDYDDNSDASRASKTQLLLNVYEALMEFCFIRNKNHSTGACEELLKLYRKHKEVYETMLKKKQTKNTKGKASQVKVALPHFTFHFLSKILLALFNNHVFKHQQGLDLLRADKEFVTYILRSCNQKLVKYNETGSVDGFSKNQTNLFKYLVTMGKVYISVYSEGFSSNFQTFETTELSLVFVEGLNLIFSIICTVFKKSANRFIVEVGDEESLSFKDALKRCIKMFQNLVIKLLSNTNNDDHLKELLPLLSIFANLYNIFTTELDDEFFKWVRQLCIEQTFEESHYAKPLVSLCLSLSHQDISCTTLMKEFACDMHYHIGDVDADEETKNSQKFEVVNSRTANSLVPVLIAHIEQLLCDVEWVLNYMKANAIVKSDFPNVLENSNYDRKSAEKGICLQLSEIIVIFHELVQTAVSPESVTNTILKLVTRLYKALNTLSKYYLLLHQNHATVLGPNFEKLVKLSGTQLTTQVYSFISYIQNRYNTENNEKKKNKTEAAAATKIIREVKTVPPLVFAIELYERNLIVLSKKYGKNLMAHMKLSTARDFRIDPAVVEANYENQEDDDGTVSDADSVGSEVSTASTIPVSSTHTEKELPMSSKRISVTEKSIAVSQKRIAVTEKSISMSRKHTAGPRKSISVSEKSIAVSEKSMAVSEKSIAMSRKSIAMSQKSSAQTSMEPEKKRKCLGLRMSKAKKV